MTRPSLTRQQTAFLCTEKQLLKKLLGPNALAAFAYVVLRNTVDEENFVRNR